jgi:NADH-quinone oxidoreductase subunit M
VLVVLSVWNYSTGLAVISAAVVILTAGYILWALQRVYLGAEYKGPHPEALTPITPRELSIAVPLLVLAIWFGVNPNSLLRYMQPSIDATVVDLADWTKANEPAKKLQAEAPAAVADQKQESKQELTTEYTEGTENGLLISSVNSVSSVVRTSER